MATSDKRPATVTIRLTDADRKLMDELGRKLGVGVSPIVRIALRALAAKEGVAA